MLQILTVRTDDNEFAYITETRSSGFFSVISLAPRGHPELSPYVTHGT